MLAKLLTAANKLKGTLLTCTMKDIVQLNFWICFVFFFENTVQEEKCQTRQTVFQRVIQTPRRA